LKFLGLASCKSNIGLSLSEKRLMMIVPARRIQFTSEGALRTISAREISTDARCYLRIEIDNLDSLLPPSNALVVCRFTAAAIAAHPAGKISSADTATNFRPADADDSPLINFVQRGLHAQERVLPISHSTKS
jgi:hypothetical protein